MRLLAIVCANGLGHFRRSIGVLDRLIARADIELTIACEAWQVERTATWPALQRVRETARFIHGITQPGVTWKAQYGDELLSWEERLAPHTGRADLVLSDNLVGALDQRGDTVLMGSFLWADVLEHACAGDARVERFAARDRALLERHRPPMLCVGDIAMPGVLARTTAVTLPWMCEKTGQPPRVLRDRPVIGVFGGATGAAGAQLESAARALEASYTVERGGEGEARYESYDLVVCRPGIGTVTACIADRVPMVLAHEPGNLELAHNTARLSELGVAIDGVNDVVAAVNRALDPGQHRAMSERMAALPDGGLDAAAGWLMSRL